jgi:pimeloyl-ACP methyl ester carboxylesterase
MNINNLFLNKPVTSKKANIPQKQVSFASNSPLNNPNVDTFIKRYSEEPKNVVFLRFTMPKFYPYPAISTVFIPKKETVPMEIPGEPVVIKSGGVDLNCWFIPPQPGKPTVLWCHGNNETIANTQIVGKQLSADGNGVMMVEYEGYGTNQGTPSEQKLYQNAMDAAKFLNEQKGIPNSHIIVMGHSLGGPIAAHTAASVPEGNHFKGLVLDSTVPNMESLVKSWIDNDYIAIIDQPKANYTLDRIKNDLKTGGGLFPTEEFIPRVPKSTKILVVHSMDDNIVDGTIGKKLMNIVKAHRPDATTIWEANSSKSHQDYNARMPAVLNFVSSLTR